MSIKSDLLKVKDGLLSNKSKVLALIEMSLKYNEHEIAAEAAKILKDVNDRLEIIERLLLTLN